jgi:Ca2+-transporting ATPase
VSIAQAVSQGRVIFQNIQKFVIYLVSCNLSEIFIVTTIGFIAPSSTILPLQILFLNMVTDVFPALALGLGKGDANIMNRPTRDPKILILSKRNWIAISLYALAMTLAVVIAIAYCEQFISKNPLITNNVAFITLAFAQLFHVFNMASSKANFWINDITKNTYVWLALTICIALLALVFAMPEMRLVLGLEILSAQVWLLAILAGLIPLLLVQGYKFILLISRKMRHSCASPTSPIQTKSPK